MKKVMLILFVMLALIGCTNIREKESDKEVTEAEILTIIAPTGAPALSLVNYVDEVGDADITTVSGADNLQAAFGSGSQDVILAPINLGVKLIQNAAEEYCLLGVVTWGNLYLVENESIEEGKVVFFGESAVPGKVIHSLDLNLEGEVVWVEAVSDVTPLLLSKEAKYGILAEPALTAALAKAKEAGVTLTVVADIQQLYNEKFGTKGYTQAALFVKKDVLESKKSEIDTLLSSMSSISTADMSKIEGRESFYGVPSAAIAEKAFERMNIHYTDAEECTEEIGTFLKLFGIEEFESVLAGYE
mgnify:CR=1 FL=1